MGTMAAVDIFFLILGFIVDHNHVFFCIFVVTLTVKTALRCFRH